MIEVLIVMGVVFGLFALASLIVGFITACADDEVFVETFKGIWAFVGVVEFILLIIFLIQLALKLAKCCGG